MKNLGFATYLKYCTSCSSSIVQEVPQASAVVCKYGRTPQLQKEIHQQGFAKNGKNLKHHAMCNVQWLANMEEHTCKHFQKRDLVTFAKIKVS